jgi:hypothetical protein
VDGATACVGSMDGRVYCVNLTAATLAWTSPPLGAGVAGGVCMDSAAVFVGAENMVVYRLDRSTGAITAGRKADGQSFYLEWPVVYSGLVLVQAAPVAAIGSEWTMEIGWNQHGGPMCDAADRNEEQDNIAAWLSGDTRGGSPGWDDASPEWKHLTVMRAADLTIPFSVPSAPFEGCGTPPEPVVVDNQNRVLTYWKTAFPTLCKTTAFGTNHTIDIGPINLTTGRREVIDNGTPQHDWYTWETDNLYGLTAGGSYLYLRQDFRGTVVMNLANSTSRLVSVTYGSQDGGDFWNADIIWRGTRGADSPPPSSSQTQAAGRVGPAVSGNAIYFVEDFAVVCAEHHQ